MGRPRASRAKPGMPADTPRVRPVSPLQAMLRRHNIRLKKSLGQNLLLDDNIHRIMVEGADITADDAVIEVGAGLGALTKHLAAVAGRLLAVEIDRSFMPALEEQFGTMPHVHIFRGDILNHPLEELVTTHLPGASNYKMVSNLPYYITTPILFHFLESSVPFSVLVVMVQAEVAQRMSAVQGSKDYGVLTLALRCYGEVDLMRKVPATCFKPRPEVDSSVVRIRMFPPDKRPVENPTAFMRVVRGAFSQRRKMLLNALTGSLGLSKDIVEGALLQVNIAPQRRAETVSFEEFQALAHILSRYITGNSHSATVRGKITA